MPSDITRLPERELREREYEWSADMHRYVFSAYYEDRYDTYFEIKHMSDGGCRAGTILQNGGVDVFLNRDGKQISCDEKAVRDDYESICIEAYGKTSPTLSPGWFEYTVNTDIIVYAMATRAVTTIYEIDWQTARPKLLHTFVAHPLRYPYQIWDKRANRPAGWLVPINNMRAAGVILGQWNMQTPEPILRHLPKPKQEAQAEIAF